MMDLVEQAEAVARSIKSETEALERLPAQWWWHSIELAGGTRIESPHKTFEILGCEFDACFGDVNLAGRSVLDIGAWNGAFSFEAKRRGAARVLAADHFVWTNHGGVGLQQFLYARRNLAPDIEYRLIDIPDVSLDTVGQFDVALLLGVFYHLVEPISILQRMRRIVKELLIVETHLDLQDLPYPAMRFYPGSELLNDPTNWWGPNRPCVEGLLNAAGFKDVRFQHHPLRNNRGVFHAR
jgi:tRNA (mo5U34)-methyltransferase